MFRRSTKWRTKKTVKYIIIPLELFTCLPEQESVVRKSSLVLLKCRCKRWIHFVIWQKCMTVMKGGLIYLSNTPTAVVAAKLYHHHT